jgi:Tol biopolymer transport system component
MIADAFAGGHADISPDDKRVLFDITDPTAGPNEPGSQDIWVRDLERGLSSRLTFDRATNWIPIWSPDGERIVFTSDRDDPTPQIYQKDSDGGGEAEAFLRSEGMKHHMSWSMDGRFLAFEAGGVGQYDLSILPLSGQREPYSFLSTQFMEIEPQFSPDGRCLAYASNESGRYEVYIRPFDQAEGGKWQLSTGGGVQPKWRRDGAELYYLAADGKIMAVLMQPTATSPGPLAPQALFQTQFEGTSSIPHFDVTPDGERFLIAATSGAAETVPLTVVLNWNSGME